MEEQGQNPAIVVSAQQLALLGFWRRLNQNVVSDSQCR
jgi:hypothetical protein